MGCDRQISDEPTSPGPTIDVNHPDDEVTSSEWLHGLASKRDGIWAIIVGVTLTLSMVVLQPRIGIRDADAYTYIVGSYSFQAGTPYVSLNGEPLNVWPPGYSFVLSWFADPIAASFVINCAALGVAASLLFLLARRQHWSRRAALSLSLAMGYGFFHLLATNATPDIFTYAVFLLGALAYLDKRSRLLAYLLWAILIPVKLIALAFVPAGLITEALGLTGENFTGYRRAAAAAGAWAIALAALLLFNLATEGAIISAEHESTTIERLAANVYYFATIAPRTFLAAWYGSIRSVDVILPVAAVLILGVASLATLKVRPAPRTAGYLGLVLIAVFLMMLLVRNFDIRPRLIGYALLLLFFLFIPRPRWDWLWLLYGLSMVALSVVNVLQVNALGANDPRYKALAATVVAQGMLPDNTVYTNSFHILDIHERVATQTVESLEALPDESHFLHIKLPQYDGIATIVLPVEIGSEWCLVRTSDDADLYTQCR